MPSVDERLMSAIERGDIVACRKWIGAGAKPDAVVDHRSALEVATYEGYPEMVNVLLNAGARPDGRIESSVTPLYQAACQGNIEVARLLVAAGADIHREALGGALTPTAGAEYWSFLGQNRREVATYLRSLGGQNPYNDPNRPEDQWDGREGELHLRFIERALASRVSPFPYQRVVTGRRKVSLYSCRFDMKKHLFRLLFTVHLSTTAQRELALALPGRWPLHREALELQRFAWPLDFLCGIADRVKRGAVIEHGDVIDREHPLAQGLQWPSTITQWLIVRHESADAVRRELSKTDKFIAKWLRPTLLVVPLHSKKSLKSGAPAKTAADTKARVKWAPPALGTARNGLAIPLVASAESVSMGSG